MGGGEELGCNPKNVMINECNDKIRLFKIRLLTRLSASQGITVDGVLFYGVKLAAWG